MANPLFRKKSLDVIKRDYEAGLSDSHGDQLKKELGVRDLTALGIAAVIGAGIFSTIGSAAHDGGPGITILFIITAITCGFSALCYAEFASRVPVAGSAYTYAYVSFGELIAWVIGWALILEYAIGNIAVAIGWSGYFNNLLEGLNLHLPAWLSTNYEKLSPEVLATAPKIGSIPIVMNLPAFLIVVLITYIVYIGIRESKRSTNLMVLLKILVIIFVIVVGFFYVQPANWSPFLPNEFSGVLKGVSAVFFAYIGFDAISTTAEECRNPQRDLPRGMIYSLVICTILYILVALVLTGMVSYSELNVDDPLAFVFKRIGLDEISYIISISAVIATASVLLVFQMGQPRIWMSMSRDGLLPRRFSRIHPKFRTPSFATILTGLLVGIPALFLDLSIVTNLTSIGTLFAFVLVCGGVLTLPPQPAEAGVKRFRLPYINGQFIVPVVIIAAGILFWSAIKEKLDFSQGWNVWKHNIPFYLFILVAVGVAFLTFVRRFSLIPVLGMLSSFYLMTEIALENWIVFGIWLAAGLSIYALYGYRKSKLAAKTA